MYIHMARGDISGFSGKLNIHIHTSTMANYDSLLVIFALKEKKTLLKRQKYKIL